MAKNYSKKDKKSSLIFMWVLIVLLAVGTVFTVKSYYDNNHSIVHNLDLAEGIGEKLKKPIGKITNEDISEFEGAELYIDTIDWSNLVYNADGTVTLNSDTMNYIDQITLYLAGYNEKYDELSNDDDGLTNEDYETLNDYYTTITLSDLNLAKDLTAFTGLKQLVISNNGSEDFSYDLSTASVNLETLSLSGCTVKNFDSVDKLVNLTSLGINGTKTSDISAIKALSKLESLSVSGEEISDISAVENLAALKSLSVTNTSVEILPNLEKLTELENVDLSNNKISNISALSVLNNDKISALNISGNTIEDYSPIQTIDESKVTKDEPESEESEENEDETSTEQTDSDDNDASQSDDVSNSADN